MKNTKNILMTGVILTSALFASVQIFAMLTDAQRDKVSTLARQAAEEYYANISIYNQVLQNRNSTDLQIKRAQDNMDTAGDRTKAYYDLLLRTKRSYSSTELQNAINKIKSNQF